MRKTTECKNTADSLQKMYKVPTTKFTKNRKNRNKFYKTIKQTTYVDKLCAF